MNALRNLFTTRTLSALRQNGQNALINITQPTDAAQNNGQNSTTSLTGIVKTEKRGPNQPLLIPKSILDATKFNGKQFGPAPQNGSISPTTLKRFRSMERKVELVYRCKLCNTRNSKLVTEAAYSRGVVILQCDGCAVNHLIIDNLGWFANTKGKSFDEVLAENSDVVKVIKVNQHGELI